mgnify:CR=1 FL=1
MQELLNIFLVLFVILKVIDLHSLSVIDCVLIVLFAADVILSIIKLLKDRK